MRNIEEVAHDATMIGMLAARRRARRPERVLAPEHHLGPMLERRRRRLGGLDALRRSTGASLWKKIKEYRKQVHERFVDLVTTSIASSAGADAIAEAGVALTVAAGLGAGVPGGINLVFHLAASVELGMGVSAGAGLLANVQAAASSLTSGVGGMGGGHRTPSTHHPRPPPRRQQATLLRQTCTSPPLRFPLACPLLAPSAARNQALGEEAR